MNIIKHVPLGQGLTAAASLIDGTQTPDPVNETFTKWFAAARDWTKTPTIVENEPTPNNRSGLLHHPYLPVEHVQALIAEVRLDTPAGRAWHTQITQNLTLTLEDTVRGYDEAIFDTADEISAAEEMTELADMLAEASPLLGPVADELVHFTPLRNWTTGEYRFTISEMTHIWARLTSEGVIVGSDGHCDKHDGDCYGDDRKPALWAHIDAIHPDTETTVRALVDRMRANLPTIATADSGRSRRTG